MIQRRGPLKVFFIYSALKSKKKQITAQPQFVINLKKGLLYISKQAGKENTYLRKINAGFIKKKLFLLKILLIDSIILMKQNLIKKIFVLYKKTIKKARNISKNTCFFIKNTIFIFYHKTT